MTQRTSFKCKYTGFHVDLPMGHLHAAGLRVVGNIWCVGAGETSSHPIREANSVFRKVD